MAHYRLTSLAEADIEEILRSSGTAHGEDARARYRGLLSAAFRRVTADPGGGASVARDGLHPGMRSLHLRHARKYSREAPVAHPVHIVFYRVVAPGTVMIDRVLHERMDPSRHLDGDAPDRS